MLGVWQHNHLHICGYYRFAIDCCLFYSCMAFMLPFARKRARAALCDSTLMAA